MIIERCIKERLEESKPPLSRKWIAQAKDKPIPGAEITAEAL
jgi:hypothetical protein